MKTNSELKEAAIRSLSGQWGNAAVLMLVYGLIVVAVSGILSAKDKTGASGLLVYFLLYPMIWGAVVAFLDVTRGSRVNIGTLFEGFNDFVRIAVTGLLKYVYTVLWTLLLIIPGIIKAYSYSMTDYIMRDDPNIKYNAAIEKSMQMMDGNKMRLFMLDLSFIGWAILCLFTLGIGFLFLGPYVSTAHAHFYEDLKRDDDFVTDSIL